MRISMKLVTLLAVVGLSAWPLLSMAEPDEKSDYYSASESDNRQDGEKPGKEPCDKKAAAALGDEPCDKKAAAALGDEPCDKKAAAALGDEPCDKKAAAALGDEPCDKKGESDDEKPCDKEKKSAAED
ncbi:MAG: hypothetical protein L3J94_02375 [Gammaproteobacteria bacterium]|nr:hypothetical protein [Gammaproteobacteria bacterium]